MYTKTPPSKAAVAGAAPGARYRFGRFELRPAQRELRRDGLATELGGRAFDLLTALVIAHGRVVSKDELFDSVWGDLPVEPNNLQVQVWALRRLLGPQAIVTVARRGYRFTPKVEVLGQVPERAPHAGAGGDGHDRGHHHGHHRGHDAGDGCAETDPLLRMLAPQVLLTLTGRTPQAADALARRVAARLAGTLGGGVWWLEAATAADGSAMADLFDRLAPHDALLIVSGCDRARRPARQIIRRAFELVPRLRVLALAQTALRMAGEHVLRAAQDDLPAAPAPSLHPLRWPRQGRR